MICFQRVKAGSQPSKNFWFKMRISFAVLKRNFIGCSVACNCLLQSADGNLKFRSQIEIFLSRLSFLYCIYLFQSILLSLGSQQPLIWTELLTIDCIYMQWRSSDARKWILKLDRNRIASTKTFKLSPPALKLASSILCYNLRKSWENWLLQ